MDFFSDTRSINEVAKKKGLLILVQSEFFWVATEAREQEKIKTCQEF